MLKTVLSFLPKNYRKKVVITGAVILVAVFLMGLFLGGSSEPVPSVQSITDRQTYETQRTERIIQMIDERKEAEQNAAKKPIADDDVLNVLGGLLKSGEGRDTR